MKFLGKRRLAEKLYRIARELGESGADETYTYQNDHFKIVRAIRDGGDLGRVNVYLSTIEVLSAWQVWRSFSSLHPDPTYWEVTTFRPGLWVYRVPVLLAEVRRVQKIRLYRECYERELRNAPVFDLDMESRNESEI
jgi:hypothetical protein